MGDFKSSLVQDDWQGGVRDGAGKGLVDNLDNGGCDGFKLDRRQVYGEPTVWETLVDVFGNNPSGYARIWYRPDNRSYDLAFTMNTNDSTCVTNAISAAEAQNVTCVPAKSINGRGEEPESVAIRPVVWDNNQ
ncbi:MAG: hypothetical protein M1838_001513 [Thelocarpon superellum]|nr:MAG: hypothetical protein M1838_001513 [Thelocarpon superellum]